MLLCDCVQDYFRTYLIQQRGYGPNTLASYRDTFKLLVSFVGAEGMDLAHLEVSDTGAEFATRFLSWLESTRGSAASTRNVRLAHLKSFASYASSVSPDDLGACAGIMSVPPKRCAAAAPDSLSREEVALLLAHPGTSTRRGLRDSAMLALLYDSACRAQELVDLDVRDVATAAPCHVSVVGKGRKARRIPLLRETGDLVGSYIRDHPLGGRPDVPLFVNRSGRRLTRAGVSDVVERHWEKVAEAHPDVVEHGRCRPHLLRHSKATHLVEEDVNIYYVRDFLGHSSVTTTQVYLKSNVERVRKAVQEAASGIIGSGLDYYTEEKREGLLSFLETLV